MGAPTASAFWCTAGDYFREMIDVLQAMKVDANHLNQTVDTIVLVGYAPPSMPISWYMFVQQAEFMPWGGDISQLSAYRSNETLQEYLTFQFFSGSLPPGQLFIHFGYRLADGQIVFNVDAINALVSAQ